MENKGIMICFKKGEFFSKGLGLSMLGNRVDREALIGAFLEPHFSRSLVLK